MIAAAETITEFLGAQKIEPESYQPKDRRPIGSRDTRWAIKIANWLADKNVSPNGISVFGMVAAVVAGVVFALTSVVELPLERLCWIVGGLLCQVRLLCNLFDGMVAIQRNVASPIGELYNEVPDRVSDAAIMVGLGYATTGYPAAGWLAGLLCVFVAYVRAMGKSAGAGNDFCGPMAKPQRMALATGLAAFMGLAPIGWRVNFQLFQVEVGLTSSILFIVSAGCVVTGCRRLLRITKKLKGKERDNG